MAAEKITTREKDYSQWYLDIVNRAGLAENSEVRGCMVIKPWGYGLWENIQRVLDGNQCADQHRDTRCNCQQCAPQRQARSDTQSRRETTRVSHRRYPRPTTVWMSGGGPRWTSNAYKRHSRVNVLWP